MSLELLVILIPILALSILTLVLIQKRIPRRLKSGHFNAKWKELQLYCKDKATWREALVRADHLLDEALKRRRFKGKSMGERLVAAQRKLSNNDGVWYAHNLCKKAIDDAELKLRQNEVKRALLGIRQALKDLGAFTSPEQESSDNSDEIKS